MKNVAGGQETSICHLYKICACKYIYIYALRGQGCQAGLLEVKNYKFRLFNLNLLSIFKVYKS